VGMLYLCVDAARAALGNVKLDRVIVLWIHVSNLLLVGLANSSFDDPQPRDDSLQF
jgi:hypothetical protein